MFSQSLLSLDLIEDFLNHWDDNREDDDDVKATLSGGQGWVKNLDYFRMDGSTSVQNRTAWADTLNSENNPRSVLALVYMGTIVPLV